MRFVAIDFETANPCLSSICQIGVVIFDDDAPTDTWQTLINPDDYFDEMNTSVHGIKEDDVKDAPAFPEVYERLCGMLAGQIIVHHTGFDRIALARAVDKHALPAVQCNFLDTARVVRRTWPEVAYRGYGLSNMAKMLGIDFRHHTAVEDARAAGQILVQAIRISGMALPDWLIRIKKPINLSKCGSHGHEDHRRTGNPEGALAGETVVFTGTLAIPKREAADAAAEAGCVVAGDVTKATTLLVVGNQVIRKLAGHEKSAKHRKAESLIAKGHAIRILGESDFQLLICEAGT